MNKKTAGDVTEKSKSHFILTRTCPGMKSQQVVRDLEDAVEAAIDNAANQGITVCEVYGVLECAKIRLLYRIKREPENQ